MTRVMVLRAPPGPSFSENVEGWKHKAGFPCCLLRDTFPWVSRSKQQPYAVHMTIIPILHVENPPKVTRR